MQGGWLGELHPSLLEGTWGAFELDLDELAELAPGEARYAEVSAYPPVRQDLAFVVDEDVLAGDLVAAAREAAARSSSRRASSTCTAAGRSPRDGSRSRCAVAFQAPDRTLSDEDARRRSAAASSPRSRERFGAELRA